MSKNQVGSIKKSIIFVVISLLIVIVTGLLVVAFLTINNSNRSSSSNQTGNQTTHKPSEADAVNLRFQANAAFHSGDTDKAISLFKQAYDKFQLVNNTIEMNIIKTQLCNMGENDYC